MSDSPGRESATSPDQLMTLDQLADFLQMSKSTLYTWRHRGEGPPGVKVGRYVRYRRRDVEAWLDRHGSPVA